MPLTVKNSSINLKILMPLVLVTAYGEADPLEKTRSTGSAQMLLKLPTQPHPFGGKI